jgi:hypothetical protein
MRPAFLLTLLAASLLAGCASSDPPAAIDSPGPDAPGMTATTEDVPFSGPALAGAGGVGLESHYAFDVPADGVLRLTAEAEWSCVSLCRLDAVLLDPNGDEAAKASGGTELSMVVENPASGEWTFVYRPGEQATVGVDGTLHLTFERLA